jgi:hypothetical protein
MHHHRRGDVMCNGSILKIATCPLTSLLRRHLVFHVLYKVGEILFACKQNLPDNLKAMPAKEATP